MLGKRQTRGNVAIAALLFVTAIGVGAVALDSARVATNPRSQLAEAGSSESRGYAKNDGTTCIRGFDYLIKLNSDKKPEVFATKSDQLNDAIKLPDGNQCASLTATVPARGQIPARQCTEQAWKCYVTFCKPKGFSGENLKKQECIFINKPIPVGGDIDKQKAVVDSGFSQDIAKAALSDNKAERDGAMEFKPALPSVMQSNLDSAFRDVQTQEEKVAVAQKNYEEALTKLTACEQREPGSGVSLMTCSDGAVTKAQAEYEKEMARLNALRNSSQSLAGEEKKLQVPSSESKPCGGMSDVTSCVKDASGKYVRDERTNDKYVPPQATIKDSNDPRNQGNPGSPGAAPSASSGSGFNAGDLLKTLGQALPLINSLANLFGGSSNAPTCTLRVSPTNITSPGQSVTLSWTTTNAQSAYLSNVGQVGPSGSMTVNPQQATTFSMQVTGYPQQTQQSNPYGGNVQQDQYCITSTNPTTVVQTPAYPGCFNYRTTGTSASQPYAQSAPQQGQCQVQLTAGQGTGTDASTKPKAQISCQPKIADVGMQVSISYACQNSNTSSGEGFSTNSQLSGSATTTVASPSLGSTTVTYGVTCSKDGVTDSAQCTTNVNKPSIVLVANPRDIEEGERTTIGWVTGAMDKCVISSPTLSDFTEDNKDSTNVSGSVRTPELTRDTNFVLTCTTKAGTTKTAETTVRVDD